MFTLYTFGDSILDCGHYNQYGVHPAQLIVQNDDQRFPEFRGQDLQSQGPVWLVHRAQDGAVIHDLPAQVSSIRHAGFGAALVTIGGNDLLSGLIMSDDSSIVAWKRLLEAYIRDIPIRPVLLGNVYDPTLGEDDRNFLGVPPVLARRKHRVLNDAIADVASRYGVLVNLHAHFLTGDPSWLTQIIEPSLVGASEVRRAFLPHVLKAYRESGQ